VSTLGRALSSALGVREEFECELAESTGMVNLLRV
jgi:hypothetical protein